MSDTIKVLGQSEPAAATLTTLYTVPVGASAVISSLVVCNITTGPQTFRAAVRPAGEAIANKHYLYYDVSVPGNDTFVATLGITLATTDVFSIYSTNDDALAFNLFGTEVS